MKSLSILLCAVGLAACSGKPPEPQAKPAAEVATPFDTLKASEQRARDVQNTVDQHAAEQRRQIEAQQQ
ncbi:MAG TPA: hypothetical protein VIL60_13060 [Rhodanobacter sp.]